MNPAVAAHIEAQARLRAIATRLVERAWTQLPAYDESDVPGFLAAALPGVLAAQRASVSLTDAFLARRLHRTPAGLNPDTVIGAAARAGATPAEVYRRPFVTVWTALKAGTQFDQAVAAGLARATGTAAIDVQLAMRQTLIDVGDQDPAIRGYQRVADPGACAFCQAIDGAKLNTDSPQPLHNGCGCGVDVITTSFEPTPLPDSVAVHDHGELGPVLGDPAHSFTQL